MHLKHDGYAEGELGKINAEIINNLMVNIIENSYGKPYIKMDHSHFSALQEAKRDNYSMIYKVDSVRNDCDKIIRPMMGEMFERLLKDLQSKKLDSPIFTHHIAYVEKAPYQRESPYAETDPNLIVSDYIASMTDDYFIDLYHYLFPDSNREIQYKGYFDD